MQIPFSLPHIDEAVIAEVNDCLRHTGWLTSGPKVLALEDAVKAYTGAPAVLCVNSWTSGAMLMLRWLGVGPGDEVIVPAYTYAATALCALNIGAKVVMVDVREDFTLDTDKLIKAITPRTKAVIPVDIGGWPADYDAIYAVVNSPEARAIFQAESPEQEKLGRLMVLADAAHSIGAVYRGRRCGLCADATIFSFHSVKNITTGEGGAVCLNLPPTFHHETEYRFLKAFSLNGQTKSAFDKNQPGAWRYDIIAQGLKANMPDLCAAVGLAQMRQYEERLMPERRAIFEQYLHAFQADDWATLPPYSADGSHSSGHLFMLRIRGAGEEIRDRIIQRISEQGVGVNVHYIPMPMLTLFKKLDYRIADYPNTYQLYQGEISLPIYNGLSGAQIEKVIDSVRRAVQEQ
ncbi:MAG: DegT/DnrJ/EryC1/StrS family aminotransferase [Saprospiraceae bacterium]|nr:DegT/DnrJ/EryC1/StrS family aminotransferase [Saprospiraceae bacterium]